MSFQLINKSYNILLLEACQACCLTLEAWAFTQALWEPLFTPGCSSTSGTNRGLVKLPNCNLYRLTNNLTPDHSSKLWFNARGAPRVIRAQVWSSTTRWGTPVFLTPDPTYDTEKRSCQHTRLDQGSRPEQLLSRLILRSPKGLAKLFWSLRNTYEQNFNSLFLTQYKT